MNWPLTPSSAIGQHDFETKMTVDRQYTSGRASGVKREARPVLQPEKWAVGSMQFCEVFPSPSESQDLWRNLALRRGANRA